jgi:hypothetical protein
LLFEFENETLNLGLGGGGGGAFSVIYKARVGIKGREYNQVAKGRGY